MAADDATREAQQIARGLVDAAKRREPELTRLVKQCAEEAGGEVVGLEFCIKSEESLVRKIKEINRRKEAVSLDFAKNIKDVNRYTIMFSETNFVDGFTKSMGILKKSGNDVISVSNTLKDVNTQYRGVNTSLKRKDDSMWELQFHTPKSLEIKEINHKMYEISRLSTTPKDEKERLVKLMEENAKTIPTPKNVEEIKDK